MCHRKFACTSPFNGLCWRSQETATLIGLDTFLIHSCKCCYYIAQMLTCRQGLYYEYVIAIISIADSIRNDISISIFSSTCARIISIAVVLGQKITYLILNASINIEKTTNKKLCSVSLLFFENFVEWVKF